MSGARTRSVEGVVLNLDWRPGKGIRVADGNASVLPAKAGLYAFVHHDTRLVRNGETGNLRKRFSGERGFFRGMRAGTSRPQNLRRLHIPDPDPYMVAARDHGTDGWEYFVVSADRLLEDKQFRQQVERALFKLVAEDEEWISCNRQRSWW